MFDAMLTLACEDALDREYAEAKAYAEANPVIPSEDFHKRMEKLIRGGTGKPANAEQPQNRRILRVSKRIAVVLMILCTISFVTLMCSAAVRVEVYRMASNIIQIFNKENPDVPLDGEEFQDYQSNKQTEQLENAISNALSNVGLSVETRFTIHIDGWLNVTISGIDVADALKIKPYIEPMAGILSSAYASENKNQLYYVQSVILADEAIKDETADDYSEAKIENRRIIREYMLANDVSSTDEIMKQTRNISFANGKLVFEGK